jgi:hypothetical protein
MITQCCVCRKVRRGERWRALRLPLEPETRVSHGYCPTCAAEVHAEIFAYVATNGAEAAG